MNVPFAAVVTPDNIVFTDPTGKTHTVSSSNAIFQEVKTLVRSMGTVKKDEQNNVMIQLMRITAPATLILDQSVSGVSVVDGVVYYNNNAVHSALTGRIIWGLQEGFNMKPYIAFMENVMLNTSNRAVIELFTFIEKNKMGITEDGHILGYKRVRENFFDIHSGTMDNSPGKIVSMDRNMVNDNPNSTCSNGLHFCSQSYLPHFGAYNNTNKIVIVKVNPADVVSVPIDHNAAKVRTCRYEVISEYTGTDKDDLLASKAVFSEKDFFDNSDEDEELDEDFLDDDDDDKDELDEEDSDENKVDENEYFRSYNSRMPTFEDSEEIIDEVNTIVVSPEPVAALPKHMALPDVAITSATPLHNPTNTDAKLKLNQGGLRLS